MNEAAITAQQPLSRTELQTIDAYWRAANYLSVGQIYLMANPLLTRPLQPEDVKPRLLGHWGTTPGLNLLYAHLNRVIRAWDLNMIFLAGPGHGGPAVVANTWLEGTYSEIYSHVTRDAAGMEALFRQFSFPGGIPSHVAPETPGSIHEGGELGYALAHAYGAVFDNPGLIAACVIGDGEAETGPLDACVREIDDIHRRARDLGDPKGTFRAHQVPIANVRGNPAHLAQLEEWLLRQLMTDKRIEARAYTREFGEDAPEINNWAWPQ
jgi:phosphoketolase